MNPFFVELITVGKGVGGVVLGSEGVEEQKGLRFW